MHSYRVIIGVAAEKLDLAMQNLPEPSAERHGVNFIRAYKEVILPGDIRRLSGETMIAFLIYKVKFAPPGSPYQQGRYYNDADITRQITQTEADIAANDRRTEALLRGVEVEIASQDVEQKLQPTR